MNAWTSWNGFVHHETERLELEQILRTIGDLERLASKIAVGRISPREMVQLKIALQAIKPLKEQCLSTGNEVLTKWTQQLDDCETLSQRIDHEIREDAPSMLNKGNVIAPGVNTELDELREISSHGKELLLKMQQREIENTGIPTLKISFNNVFGYYIEVTKTHVSKVPDTWIRKQTLVNAERYITPELKEYEEKILGAEDRIQELESDIYNTLLAAASSYIKPIQLDAASSPTSTR